MSWYRNWKGWGSQSYPQKLLRGIPTADCLDANGWITGQLFRIPDTKNTPQRHDGFDEISINWYDNEKSMTVLMTQKKKDKDTLQFPYGVAVLSRKRLDDLIRHPNTNDDLDYERDPIIGENPYHGNILQKREITKPRRKMLEASLAMWCFEYIETPKVQQ